MDLSIISLDDTIDAKYRKSASTRHHRNARHGEQGRRIRADMDM
jgi:hypothetical protein